MDSICDCVAGWESFVDCYGKLYGIIVIKRNGRSVKNKKNIHNQKISHKAIKFENNSKWHSWKKNCTCYLNGILFFTLYRL